MVKISQILLFVIFHLVDWAFTAQIYPFCQQKPQLISTLYLSSFERYTYQLDRLFSGNSLNFSCQSNVPYRIFQTYTETDQRTSPFDVIISYDVWSNPDGSSTHSVLDKSGALTRLFFGTSQSQGAAPIWNTTFFSITNIRKCYSVTMVNGFTAALDCYSQQGTSFSNVLFIINYYDHSIFYPQIFKNWPEGLSQIYSYRTTQRFFNTNNTISGNINENLGLGNQNLYLISGIIENDPLGGGKSKKNLFYVYEVIFNSSDLYPNGVLNYKQMIMCSNLNLTDCSLTDFSITENQIFALTKENIVEHKVIQFEYSGSSVVSIQSLKLVVPSIQISAIQKGKDFTIGVLSDQILYEWNWIGNAFSSLGKANRQYYLPFFDSSDVTSISFSYDFLTVVSNNTALFYLREYDPMEYEPSLVSYQVSNSQYPLVFKLLPTNQVFFTYPTTSSAGIFRSAYIVFENSSLNNKTNSVATLQATSVLEKNSDGYECTYSFAITTLPTVPQAGVYSTSVTNATIYRTYQGVDQTFAIDNVFMGPNLQYSLTLKEFHRLNLPASTSAYYSPIDQVSFIYEISWQDQTYGLPNQFYQFLQGASQKLYVMNCTSSEATFSCYQVSTVSGLSDQITSLAPFYSHNLYLFVATLASTNNPVYYTFAGLQLGEQSFGGANITSVSINAQFAYFVSQSAKEISVCKVDDYTTNPFNVPCLWTLSAYNTANWPGVNTSTWNPYSVLTNPSNGNLFYIENFNNVILVEIIQNLPVYVNTLSLPNTVCPLCSRVIFAAQSSLLVIQSFNSSYQAIAQFETMDPQQPFLEQQIPLFGYNITSNYSASFSVQTNILYVTAQVVVSQKQTDYVILAYKAEMPVLNSLYFVGTISKPVAASIFSVLVGSINLGSDFITVFRDNTQYFFFIPKTPTITLNVTIEKSDSYVINKNYTILVGSGLDAKQKSVPFQMSVQVANPSTRTQVHEDVVKSAFKLNLPSNQTTFAQISDAGWVSGSYLGYTPINTAKVSFSGHIQKGLKNIQNITDILSLTTPLAPYPNNGSLIIMLSLSNSLYVLDQNYQLLEDDFYLNMDPSKFICLKQVNILNETTNQLVQTLIMCLEYKLLDWYTVVVSWDGAKPIINNKIQIPFLKLEDVPPKVDFYNGFLYVLDGPLSPQPGNEGSVTVFQLDFQSSTASLIITFNSSLFSTPYLNLVSFVLEPTYNSGISQFFLLDSQGRRIIYGTYDDTFKIPSQSLLSYGSIEVGDFILANPNGYLLPSTRFINLVPLQRKEDSTQTNLTFNLMIVTSNTAFYEIKFDCTYNASTLQGICDKTNLTRVWNRYGPNATLVNTIQQLGDLVIVPYYIEDIGTMIITMYNQSSKSFMNTIFDGFISSELSAESNIFSIFRDVNGNIQILSVDEPNGSLAQTFYNPYITLNVTNTQFQLEEFLLKVDSIYLSDSTVRLPITNYNCKGIFQYIHYKVCKQKSNQSNPFGIVGDFINDIFYPENEWENE